MQSYLWQYFSGQPSFQVENGLYFTQEEVASTNFEDLYTKLRSKEGRYYSDDIVKFLPEIDPTHSLHKEWVIRKSSARRLASYIKNQRPQTPTILEIGCGNGWLSNFICSRIPSVYCGFDINETELKQAARLFSKFQEVFFVHADILTAHIPEGQVDYILLASSIQYFKNLKGLIDRLIPLLTSNGEIHIIDSPVYQTAELASAKERTKAYFTIQGFDEMNAWYFHHTWTELESFNYEILARRTSRIRGWFTQGARTPFPWIKITV